MIVNGLGWYYMGLSMEQHNIVKQEFAQKYLFQEPFSNYVNLVGTSSLNAMQRRGEKFDLKAGETLDDLCIGVGFKEQPPENLEFPTDYKGVRVFYEIMGEIVPLKNQQNKT